MQQVKERPILFKPEMVQAILEGRKTQTRRVIKNVKGNCIPFGKKMVSHVLDAVERDLCPYGKVGDRLWVRENFKVVETSSGGTSNEAQCYGEDDYFSAVVQYTDGTEKFCDDLYIDTEDNINQPEQAVRFSKKSGWCPNIFMPRWACRLELEITNIRVERLQDISEGDAISEGVEKIFGEEHYSVWKDYTEDRLILSPIESFKSIWNSTGGKWKENPWVWVIDFKVVERE